MSAIISNVNSPAADTAARSNRRGFADKWVEEVDTGLADRVCVILYLITGLCDSGAFNAWSCFLAMQTGMCISSRSPCRHL